MSDFENSPRPYPDSRQLGALFPADSRIIPKSTLTPTQAFGLIPLPLSGGKTMYAILETGGKQYRVAAGDKLRIERVEADAGQTYTFNRVLLVNQDGQVTLGAPTVPPRPWWRMWSRTSADPRW
jgi:hypothetical protein